MTASDLDISALCNNPVSFAELPLAMSRDHTRSNATDHFSFADTPRLTRALRDGNEEAFRFLHTEWNRRLSRYCFVLAQCDVALAHEVVQNTYLRIFRYAREFPDEGIFWNWVVCVARSAAADLRRSGGRYRKAVTRFAEWLRADKVRILGPPDESFLNVALDNALATLTPEEQRLIEARYTAQSPLSETAAAFGASTRAIEGRLARIRAKLRKEIAAQLAAYLRGGGSS